jgi:D-lactate dehydrogenase
MDQRAIDAIRPTGARRTPASGTRAADGRGRRRRSRSAAPDRRAAAGARRRTACSKCSGFERDHQRSCGPRANRCRTPVKAVAPLKINEDVVVPVSELAGFVDFIDRTANAHRLAVVSFGHAGNGNLHVNLMVHPDDADEMDRAHLALDAIILRALALGGTLSGEHGIGTEKRRFVDREIDPATLGLMRAIKQQFDPLGLLNPGKLFPD